jgi:LytS/YehU family sensor histidine kinase
MMRYLLYESEHGETSLSSEIEFMNNYIDLMRLRMSDKVKLMVSFPEDGENISIPPLLFISIIENAFKHGISYREKSFIEITMEVTPKMITFRCINSIVKPIAKTAAEHSGIGLENLSKRLNLLFPDRHEFIINQTVSAFNVMVKIFFGKT